MLVMYLGILNTNEEKTKFELLYNCYKYTMHYIAFHILKDTFLAENAVSETFIRISKNFNKIGDVTTIQTRVFIYTIVKNVALTMLKEQDKTKLLDDFVDTIDLSINIEKDFLANIAIEKIT